MRSSDISNTYTCDIDKVNTADGPPYPAGWARVRISQFTVSSKPVVLDICPACQAASDAQTLAKFKAAMLGSG